MLAIRGLLLLALGQLVALAAATRSSSAEMSMRYRRIQAYLDRPASSAVDSYAASARDSFTIQGSGSNVRVLSSPLADQYPAHTFEQPLDHFDPNNNVTFQQRYWVSLRNYKNVTQREQGTRPVVIILDSGETDGADRIPYLDHGIVDILTNATGGIGIVFEHRFYGESYPARSAIPDAPGKYWSDVDALRFLNNSLALEDSANFARKLKVDGVSEDLSNAIFIVYGGSYPGARAAHLRVLYPDVFAGAIASSAVTEATEDYWQYWVPLYKGTEPACAQALQDAVSSFDEIAVPISANDTAGLKSDQRDAFLSLFGAQNLTRLADLASTLQNPLGAFQGRNWVVNASSNIYWDKYCNAMTNDSDQSLQLKQQGEQSGLKLSDAFYRYAAFGRTSIDACVKYSKADGSGSSMADQCLASNYTEMLNTEDPNDVAWPFQFCSTWGYFTISPPDTAPNTPIFPRIISSLSDHEYNSEICRKGFRPGKLYTMPEHPNVEEVNKLGGFDIAADRLFIVNGEFDPWREATPHAGNRTRADTIDRPFKLIPNCWHHCDENSLPAAQRDQEPDRIKEIHRQQVEAVLKWVDDLNNGAQ